jgi:hypothetical protein
MPIDASLCLVTVLLSALVLLIVRYFFTEHREDVELRQSRIDALARAKVRIASQARSSPTTRTRPW